MTKILYLHGFASSADSTKAKVIKSFVKKNTSSTKILIPNLDNNIKLNINNLSIGLAFFTA